ncbi:winged helix-turn-helix transcriptional regulator [Candidatus Woesearchaeota archaeon]|nr:winged helix-turn-helix transcriptional regulator [Candidatus Woesearchaeota archaeon]
MPYNLRVLKALADETRVQILLFLLKKENSVLEIVGAVKMSQPTISIALQKLEDAGLIVARKEGKKVFYSVIERETVQKILELVKHG